MNTKEVRRNVLELCSETEYGSWEFWSEKENKTEGEMELIFQVILDLVNEKKIIVLEKNAQDVYSEVELNKERLKVELKKSLQPYNVDPDTFYWFEATEEGRREDIGVRG